jgi:hypothetical protein
LISEFTEYGEPTCLTSDEDTKGHELHVPGQPTQIIQFPGMVALWQRFWQEVPKPAFDPTT